MSRYHPSREAGPVAGRNHQAMAGRGHATYPTVHRRLNLPDWQIYNGTRRRSTTTMPISPFPARFPGAAEWDRVASLDGTTLRSICGLTTIWTSARGDRARGVQHLSSKPECEGVGWGKSQPLVVGRLALLGGVGEHASSIRWRREGEKEAPGRTGIVDNNNIGC